MSETEIGFLGVTASGFIQQKTRGHYPAPSGRPGSVLLEGAGSDIDAAGELESEQMAEPVWLPGQPIPPECVFPDRPQQKG